MSDEDTTPDPADEGMSTTVDTLDTAAAGDANPADTSPTELDNDADTFPREVVEKLRQENGKYRQKAQRADTLAQRLHTELVCATGKLADPADLPFDESHLDDPDALVAAIDELLERKPHLASRRPVGDIGQGQRGTAPEPFSLLGFIKERT